MPSRQSTGGGDVHFPVLDPSIRLRGLIAGDPNIEVLMGAPLISDMDLQGMTSPDPPPEWRISENSDGFFNRGRSPLIEIPPHLWQCDRSLGREQQTLSCLSLIGTSCLVPKWSVGS